MMRPQRPHSLPRTCPQRGGFTLIEVLIALGLSLVLVSAIYSAISLHWRYETAGRDRIERAQISTAVLRLMTEDIGSVTFKAPDSTVDADANSTGTASTGSTASTGAASSSGTASTPSSTSSTGSGSTDEASSSMSGANSKSTTTASAPSSLGIVGTSDYLQLDISRSAKEDIIPEVSSVNDPAATAPVAPALSNNVRVVWAMATPSMGAIDSKGVRALTANPALARQMTDRLRQAVETLTDEANPSTAAPELEESSILAKEIVSLSFQYYDGYSWVAEWDSTTMERLPRAVEVTIGFLKPEHRKPGEPNLPGSETIIPIKHVILVPASSPVSGEEL